MNKRPVSYLQTDTRWAKKPYRVPGEDATIGGSGCGPTCAAMLIETLTGKTFTPEDACKWSLEHGYKALNQGTYYGYFKPQFETFEIECEMLSWQSSYGKPEHDNHRKAFELLRQGFYIIALMGKGLWTSSGHFVVLWWQDGKVRINDPASTKSARLNGDLETFKAQAKYYWWVDARKYNRESEDEEMDAEKIREIVREELETIEKEKKDQEPNPNWGGEARDWARETGLISGDEKGNPQWEANVTRNQLVTILFKFFKMIRKLISGE